MAQVGLSEGQEVVITMKGLSVEENNVRQDRGLRINIDDLTARGTYIGLLELGQLKKLKLGLTTETSVGTFRSYQRDAEDSEDVKVVEIEGQEITEAIADALFDLAKGK